VRTVTCATVLLWPPSRDATEVTGYARQMGKRSAGTAGTLGVVGVTVLLLKVWLFGESDRIAAHLPASWWFVGPLVGAVVGVLLLLLIGEWRCWRIITWLEPERARSSPPVHFASSPRTRRKHRHQRRRQDTGSRD